MNFRILGGVLAQFVGLSTVGSIQRAYYDRESRDLPRYIVNCLLLGIATVLILAVLVPILYSPIALATGISGGWQWSLPLFAAFTFLNQIGLGMFQVQGKPKQFGAFQIGLTALNLLLTVVLVVGVHMDWQGRVLAQVISTGTFAAVSLFVLSKGGWLKGKYHQDDFQHAVKIGSGLFFHQIGGVLNGVGDRLFLSGLAGTSAAGSYGAAYTIMMPIQLAQDAFNKSYIPWIFERLKKEEPDIKKRAVKLTYYMDAAFLSGTVLLCFIAPALLIAMTNKSYQDAIIFIPWVGFTYALAGMSKMRACYALYAERMGAQSIVTIMAGLLNLVLSYVLIKQMGVLGAGVASLSGALFYFFASWLLSNRVFPMPWFRKR